MASLLETSLYTLGFSDDIISTLLDKMQLYIQAIQDFNKRHNIVSTSDTTTLTISHILDSLVAVSHIKTLLQDNSHICDIGSGAGLPGIPLSVAMPLQRFYLAERMTTRSNFLCNAVKTLKLDNVRVLNLDIKNLKPNSFDMIVFRAFKPLSKNLLHSLFTILHEHGFIIAYKARMEKIQEELATLNLASNSYEIIKLTVPHLEDHERHLVIIKK